MKIITKEYSVYSFDELQDKAKENAIDKFRYSDTPNFHYNDDYECLADDFISDINEIGYKNAKIRYRGFYSQGDGLSFSCDIDAISYIEKNNLMDKYPLIYKYISDSNNDNAYYNITNQGFYSHSGVMELNEHYGNFNDYDIISDELNSEIVSFEKLLLDNAKNKADEFYQVLEKHYDYINSDEYIIQYFQANEIEFLDDGSIFG
jgi:hypothetical protein